MALCQGIAEILEETARREHFAHVRTVWLELGKLSSVEPDALRFCFDVVTRGGVADGAQLQIVPTPGQAWCLACSRAVEIEGALDDCPLCASRQVQVTGGTEMRIKELEVE